MQMDLVPHVALLNPSRKRHRDDEGNEDADPRFQSLTVQEDDDSCKRSSEEWDWTEFLHHNPDVDVGFTGENFEGDMISDVLKKLEQETPCECPSPFEDRICCFTENSGRVFSDNADENCGSGLSVSDSASSVAGSAYVDDIGNGCHDINIEYLLEATDDELGIPPSPNTLQLSDIFDSNDGNIFEENYSELGGEQLFELLFGYTEQQDVIEMAKEVCSPDWTMVRAPLNGGLFEGPYL